MSYSPDDVAEAVDRYSALTIPVHVSLEARQQVLSQPEMETLLAGADCIAVADCECRLEQGNCDAPLDVCLSLGESARKLIDEGRAKAIPASEALQTLRRSHQAGLVHLAYTRADAERIEAVCSCCACCCWFLNQLKGFDYHDAVAESAFVAVVDGAVCDDCGVCLDRCQFQAWERVGSDICLHSYRCFGCGLCLSACPTQAISLVERTEAMS